MSDQSLTHKDLASLVGVSETTIKSYRRKFDDCIPVASRGKPIRFTPEAGAVCLRIRDLFAQGLSVLEVRARLAEEFSWISLVVRKKKEPEAAPVALPSEFTTGVSTLAKSMVTLTQQQGGILKRLQDMEESLASPASLPVPVRPAALAASPPQTQHVNAKHGPSQENHALHAPDSLDLQKFLDDLLSPLGQLSQLGRLTQLSQLARLEQLDRLTALDSLHALDGVTSLTDALHQATGALTGAAAALNDAAARVAQLAQTEESLQGQIMALADQIAAMGAAMNTSGGSVPPAIEAETPSRVVRFPVPSDRAGQAGETGQETPEQRVGMPEQAPRELLSLPLVIRTQDGAFMPAGGKARGPFSINDLKALLAHAKTPPEHYVMQWQRAARGGWWLLLEQPSSRTPRPLHLFLRELSSQRGLSVAELVHFFDRGENMPPVQLCTFVDTLFDAGGVQ